MVSILLTSLYTLIFIVGFVATIYGIIIFLDQLVCGMNIKFLLVGLGLSICGLVAIGFTITQLHVI